MYMLVFEQLIDLWTGAAAKQALYSTRSPGASLTMADQRPRPDRGQIKYRNCKGSHDGHQDYVATGHNRLMRILLRAHPRFCSQFL